MSFENGRSQLHVNCGSLLETVPSEYRYALKTFVFSRTDMLESAQTNPGEVWSENFVTLKNILRDCFWKRRTRIDKGNATTI